MAAADFAGVLPMPPGAAWHFLALAHLHYRDQCCILFKSDEGFAQVVWP